MDDLAGLAGSGPGAVAPVAGTPDELPGQDAQAGEVRQEEGGVKTIVSKKTGIISVKITTEHGRRVVSTGTTDRIQANRIIRESKAEELETAALSVKLTKEVVAQIVAGRNITVDQAMEGWTRWRSARSSPKTVHNTLINLKAWARDSGALHMPVTAVTEEQCDGWINAEGPMKLGTRAMRLSALRSFFSYCSARTYLIGDPSALVSVDMNRLSHEQKETRQRQPFTDGEYAALVLCTEGWWNLAIRIARWSGLRLGDIAGLEWASLNGGTITVHTDKTNARVSFVMLPELAAAVAEIPPVHERFCFPEQREIARDPKRRAGLSAQFKRIFKMVGFGDKTFHDLRSAFCVHCRARGVPTPHIARLVGHADTRTTEVYLP